jgi:hypothetical protein
MRKFSTSPCQTSAHDRMMPNFAFPLKSLFQFRMSLIGMKNNLSDVYLPLIAKSAVEE